MKYTNNRYLQRRDFLLAGLTFLIIICALGGLFGMLEHRSVQESRNRCRYMATNQGGILKDSVDSALSRAYTMKALIITGDGTTDFFDTQAPVIYEEANQESGMVLKNIAVAPGGVIEKVYPLTGNENLADFDFMDESRPGNAEAIEAYQRGELVVTNPFTLVQGGFGMAGRLPVFLKNGTESKFWGLVTVTMDFDRLLAAFRLDSLEDMGMNYELWYEDEAGEKVSLISTEQLPADPVGCQITLSNLTWKLDIAPRSGWVDYTRWVLAFTVIFGIAFLVAVLLLEKIKLDRANVTLEQLANLDSLTLCFSRHYVNIVLLNQRTGQWKDPNARYSLAVLDIDYFKLVNDTYGHEAGDQAIVAVAQVLQKVISQANGDCVVRFGGDEFIVLFNDVTRVRFVDKLKRIVEEVRMIRLDDYPEIRLTVSVGGEYYSHAERTGYFEMVERADKKLYHAKKNGRDQFCVELQEKKEN